ncbi:hypothetical protein PQR71_40170 [Paraburkholderia fungorum]|uniref:hypothetical protein n=1 Tax=Paraburkholderia fungorum TaxID=134537 RepID=UPI0038BC0BFB
MATVIDSLVVALGMDASGFTKGSKDASGALKKTNDEATRTAKELELRGKQAGEFFSQIKNQALGMLAVFTAGKGLSSFVSDVVAGDAAVGRMATNIGMSTEDLSAWQGVAERAGGSAAGMSGSLKAMAQQMAQISITGTPGAQVLQSLAMAGINISKYFDKATTSSQRMLMASDAFKGMDAARAQALGARMGFDEGTVNVLMQGRQAVQALLAEQEKIGHANEADAKSAQQLQAAWRALSQASEDLGRKILTSLSPFIQDLSGALLRLSEWAAQHRGIVEAAFIAIAAALTAVTVGLAAMAASAAFGAIAAGFTAIVSIVAGAAGVFGTLLTVAGAVLAGISAPVLAIAAGIAAAIAGIAYLYRDWNSWVNGGKSTFAGFWQFFATAWKSVSGILAPLVNEVRAIWEDVQGVFQDGLAFIHALFSGTGDQIRAAWFKLFGDIGNVFSEAIQLVKDELAALPKIFSTLGPQISGGIKGAFKSGFDYVAERVLQVKDVIVNAFKGAFDWVTDRAHAVWDAITGQHTEKTAPASAATVTPAPSPAGNPAPASTQSPAAQSAAVGKSIADSAFGALISKGEGDYDSVNRGAAHGYKAGKENLAGMTINEVMAAQKAGDFKAAGRYQVMPENLTAAVKALGLSGNEKFDKGMQDKVFDQYLLSNKRKAIGDYVHGQSNDIGAAMLAASKEWASVADPRTGKSYYDGKGNNKSSITPEQLRESLEASRNSYLSGAGARVAMNKANGGAANHTTTSDVKIAQINVQTQATDAKGIAKDIGPAVKQYAFAVNANTGLS